MNLYSFLFFNFCLCFSYSIHGHLGNTTCNIIKNKNLYIYKFIKKIFEQECDVSSVWADKIKRTKKYYWTRPLHYIQLNKTTGVITNDDVKEFCKKDLCIVNSILNFVKNFNKYDSNFTINEKLKMIFHLSQDFSQPLHVNGAYQGGNLLTIIRNKKGRNKTISLHQLYDFDLISETILNYSVDYDYLVINSYSEYSNFLYYYLNKNYQNSLSIYRILNHQDYIIFEEFLEKNKKLLRNVLDNYYYFIFTTLNFIYQESTQISHYPLHLIRFPVLELQLEQQGLL